MNRAYYDTLTRGTGVTSACLTPTLFDHQVRDGNAIGRDIHRRVLHHRVALQIVLVDAADHQHTALLAQTHCKHVTHAAVHELVEHGSEHCAAVVEAPNSIDLNWASQSRDGLELFSYLFGGQFVLQR